MRVHVVSDVHGNAKALARAADRADALVVLGDLLDFVDYQNHSRGILGMLFGPEKVATFARLRASGDRERTVQFSRSLWDSLRDPAAAIEEAIRAQYDELFGVLNSCSVPVYATPGNVDLPALWPEYAGENVRVLDGSAVTIGGLRFGFVGGTLQPPGYRPRPGAAWRPYMRTVEEFGEVIESLGDVDVLCTHIPPRVPELTYDVVARRVEQGAAGVLETITTRRPRWSLFGHVHQPLAARMRIGQTECCNVGHFRAVERPFVLKW
ncbi:MULTISPECIES: metallophosphoesterase [Thermocrispum]|uniref:Metallophosphoesterase n=1 Tax=Thermocrispum agreste TaxID=37925 RepID=A0A2W4J7D4_9PSEU|nr:MULTISPECIES: metallophosphoesterase [Thermocrispum]PZM94088.1 MAG: metallophosphoesterase [Thermocrispum agreste]